MSILVVATDGSPAAGAALDAAISLGSATGDTIAAITVWRALQGDFGLAFPSAAMLGDVLDAERWHAEAVLSDATGRVDAAGLEVRTHLATGDPAAQICAYAEELGARLIAIGTRGYGSVASLLLGSVSNAVIRHASCPVLIVHGVMIEPRPSALNQRIPVPRMGISHDAAGLDSADDGHVIDHKGDVR